MRAVVAAPILKEWDLNKSWCGNLQKATARLSIALNWNLVSGEPSKWANIGYLNHWIGSNSNVRHVSGKCIYYFVDWSQDCMDKNCQFWPAYHTGYTTIRKERILACTAYIIWEWLLLPSLAEIENPARAGQGPASRIGEIYLNPLRVKQVNSNCPYIHTPLHEIKHISYVI